MHNYNKTYLTIHFDEVPFKKEEELWYLFICYISTSMNIMI